MARIFQGARTIAVALLCGAVVAWGCGDAPTAPAGPAATVDATVADTTPLDTTTTTDVASPGPDAEVADTDAAPEPADVAVDSGVAAALDTSEQTDVPPDAVDAAVDAGPPPACKVDADCPATGTICTTSHCNSAGQCVVANNDGAPCVASDPCATHASCQAGVCAAGPASWCQCSADSQCATLDDANLCNGKLYCDKAAFPFVCKVNPATVVTCPVGSDSACSKNVCAPATGTCSQTPTELATWLCDKQGCAWQAKGNTDPMAVVVPCSDGLPCTTSDYCDGGSCKAGADTCSCASNTDCLAQEDGNLCNGTLFCNKALKPAACQVNPATVVACANGLDSACEKNACNISIGKCDCPPTAKPGSCALTPAENTKAVCADSKCRYETLPFGASPIAAPACDDGNNCTTGEVCGQGSCTGGTDTCVCASDLDCKSQEDGNSCNGTLFCNKASKKCEINPATFVVCPTGLDTACVKNVCLPKTGSCGLANAASSVTCDDGDSCTVGDTCDTGACKAGTNTCSCTSDVQCAKYEDGDGCNGTMFCNKGKSPAICEVNPATVVSCPSVDDTTCLKNQCFAKTGKCQPTATADFAQCDDGNKCTKADSCLFGKCQPGTFTCECATNADCAAKDDGDLCNGTFYCDKTGDPKCIYNPGSVVFCSKNNDSGCLQAKCDAKTGGCGLAPLGDGSPCDDGSTCSESDACKAGKCAGKAKDCDDNNPCTVDGCDASGCTHKAANCADGNECTADNCDVKTGQCAFPAVLDGKTCNGDDDGCTVNDVCSSGKCKIGTAVVCKIALEACQVPACQSTGAKSFACVALPAKDGTVCSGSAACVLGFACQLGQCQPLPKDKLFVAGLGTFGKGLALQSVHPMATGAVVGGRRSIGTDDQPSGASLVVAELAGDASVVWQVEVASAGAFDDLVGMAAAQRLATGETAVVATRRFSATGDLDLWVAKLAASGKSFVADKQVVLAGPDAVFGAAYNPQVGWWAAGQQGTGSLARAWLVRLSESGTVLANWKSSSTSIDHLRAAVILSDGGALAVGDRLDGGVVRALLVRVDGQGATVWQKVLADVAPQALVAVVTAPTGIFAAGSRTAGGIDLPLLLQLDASGKVLASFVGTSATTVHSVAVLTGGRPVLAGSVGSGANSQAWTQGFTPTLEPIWSNADLSTIPAEFQTVAVAPDGGLWLVGSKIKPTTALTARSDPWGHLSCLTAGSCADKTADACDDKQGCTYDLCEPGTGCVHAPSSSPCTDSDACTVGDVCTAGTCLPGDVTTCNDSNPCTTDACDVKSGCGHGFTTSTCNDGDACTGSDACGSGVCQGVAVKCDDGSICTKDSCDSKQGCVAVVDVKACTDGNACTDDSCDGKKGCAYANNSAPCIAGDPCAEGDVCSAGVCQAGSIAKFFTQDFSGAGDAFNAIVAIAPASGGGVHFVANDQSTGLFGFLAAGGSSVVVVTPEPEKAVQNHLYALATGKSGLVYAGDTTALGAAGWDGWLHSTDSAGKLAWSYPYGGLKTEALRGVAAMDKGFIAVGDTDSSGSGGKDGWIVRVSSGGVLLSSTPVGGAGEDQFSAISPVPGGGFIVAGATTASGGGGSDGWLVRLNAAGAVVWQHTYGKAGDQTLVKAVATDDGGFAAVGAGGGGSYDAWAVKVNSSGQAGWYGKMVLPTQARNSVAAVAGGFIVASNANLYRYDNAGTLLWTKEQPFYALLDVAVLADQRIVVAGPQQGQARVKFMDSWGNGSCAEAGKCAAKVAADCDDANPCTDPGCDPASGCKPLNIEASCDAGAACTTGDSCTNGSCVAGKPRLFDLAHWPGGLQYAVGYSISPIVSRLGGLVVAGRRLNANGASPGVTLSRVGKAGEVIWTSLHVSGGNEDAFYAVAELSDGRLAACGMTSGQPNVSVFDPQGISLFASLDPFGDNGDLMAIRALPNDQLAVVGKVSPGEGVIATFTDQAKLVWKLLLTDTQSCRNLSVHANGDLEAWCVGLNSAGQQSDIVRVVASGVGKLLAAKHFATPSPIAGIAHGVDANGTTYVAASADPVKLASGQKDRIYVFKFDADGGLKWQRLIGAGVSGVRNASDIVMTSAGPVLVGQVGNANKIRNGWLAGLDPVGNLTWQREIGGPDDDAFHGGTVIENNLILVGATKSKGAGNYNEWLVRTDAWGQGPCSQSGPCVKLAAAACLDDQACTADTCSPIDGCVHEKSTCDDGNPCTTDACDATKGCQWTPLSDGTPACPNNGQCALGYCP